MLQFGPAAPTDVPRLAECWHAMLDEAGLLPGGAVPGWRERLERWFAEAMAQGRMHWEVARSGNEIVGTAAAILRDAPGDIGRGRSATLAGIFVEPPYRRRGIARELTLRAVTWCRAQGCTAVHLQASAAGRPLYESLGFRPGAEMTLQLQPR